MAVDKAGLLTDRIHTLALQFSVISAERRSTTPLHIYDVGALRQNVTGTSKKQPFLCFSNLHPAARLVEPAAVDILLKTYQFCQEKNLNIQSTIEYYRKKATFDELKTWYYTQCGLETRDSQNASAHASTLREKTLKILNVLLDLYDKILKYIDNGDVELAYFFVSDQYFNTFFVALNLIEKNNHKQQGTILEITHIEVVMENLKQCLSLSLQRILRKNYVVWDETGFIINFDIFNLAELKKCFSAIGSAWYTDAMGTLRPCLTTDETRFYQGCFDKALIVKNNFYNQMKTTMSDGGKQSITERSKTGSFEKNFQILMRFKAVYEEIRALMRPVRIRYRIYKKDKQLREDLSQELKEVYALRETLRTNLYLEHFALTMHLERPEIYSESETQTNNKYLNIVVEIASLVATVNAKNVRTSYEDIQEGEVILFKVIKLKTKLRETSRLVLNTLSLKRQAFFSTGENLALDHDVIDALSLSTQTTSNKTQPANLMKSDNSKEETMTGAMDFKSTMESIELDNPKLLQKIYELCDTRKRHHQHMLDYYQKATVEELKNWCTTQFLTETSQQSLTQNKASLLAFVSTNVKEFAELYGAIIRFIEEINLEKAYFCVRLKYLQIIFKTPSVKEKLEQRDENIEISNLKFMMDNLRQCLNQPVRKMLKRNYLVWTADFFTIDFPLFVEKEINQFYAQLSTLRNHFTLLSGQKKCILNDAELKLYQANLDKAIALETRFHKKTKIIFSSSKSEAQQRQTANSWMESFEISFEKLQQFRDVYVEVQALILPIRERHAIFSRNKQYRDHFQCEINEMEALFTQIKEKLNLGDPNLGLHLSNPANYSKHEKDVHICCLMVRAEMQELIIQIDSKPVLNTEKDFEEAEDLFTQCKALKVRLKRVTILALKTLKEKTKEFHQAKIEAHNQSQVTEEPKSPSSNIRKKDKRANFDAISEDQEQKETAEALESKKALDRKAKRLSKLKPQIKEIDGKKLVQQMHALSEQQLHERTLHILKMPITPHMKALFAELYQYQFTRDKLNNLVAELRKIGESIQIISNGGTHSTLKIKGRQGCFSSSDTNPSESKFDESGKLFSTHARNQKAKKNNALLSHIDIENILWVFYRSGYTPEALDIEPAAKFDVSKFLEL